MNIKRIITFCFSPTGTSRRNMMAVVKGLNPMEAEHRDYTLMPDSANTDEADRLCLPLATDEVAIFSVPVYGGHVAPLALQRMQQVKGTETPAILLATYGNRDFEQALSELAEFVSQRGFLPVAAGAMIGEHSYSNEAYPIASGRPDAEDLASAEEFGRQIADKLREKTQADWHIDIATDMPRVETPATSRQAFIRFVQAYTLQQQQNPVKVYPTVESNLCNHCGKCVRSCPTQAILAGHEEETDTARCIRCCACVKGCPTGARTFHSPFAPPLSENFQMRREALYLC